MYHLMLSYSGIVNKLVKNVGFPCGGQVLLPSCEFTLPAKDDTAEFDESSEAHFSDDPK